MVGRVLATEVVDTAVLTLLKDTLDINDKSIVVDEVPTVAAGIRETVDGRAEAELFIEAAAVASLTIEVGEVTNEEAGVAKAAKSVDELKAVAKPDDGAELAEVDIVKAESVDNGLVELVILELPYVESAPQPCGMTSRLSLLIISAAWRAVNPYRGTSSHPHSTYLLRNRVDGSLNMCSRNKWHNTRINNSQIASTIYTKAGVDYSSHIKWQHSGSADTMELGSDPRMNR